MDKIISFCKNLDLLICVSSLLRKCKSNNRTHMTAYDAGLLAKKSCVKKLLVTHFWLEENKLLYLEEAKLIFNNVEIA